jgi:TetR/AcrR family transcriptional regulator, regulator of biofilm formation and stress response
VIVVGHHRLDAKWYICTTIPLATPNRTRPRGTARRDALLDAVIRIVAEVGADAVTHRRVAQVADLPLASTTYWFESKEHMLTAAVERAADRDIARLQAFLDQAPRTPSDPLELAVDAILDPGDEPAQAIRGSLVATYALLLEAARRPALRAVTRRWTDAYRQALARLLALAGSRDPSGDAALLLGAADGLVIDRLAAGEGFELRPELRRLATALVTV